MTCCDNGQHFVIKPRGRFTELKVFHLLDTDCVVPHLSLRLLREHRAPRNSDKAVTENVTALCTGGERYVIISFSFCTSSKSVFILFGSILYSACTVFLVLLKIHRMFFFLFSCLHSQHSAETPGAC